KAARLVLLLTAVTVTDTAGNANLLTDTATITIDPTALHVALPLQSGSDTGTSNSDNVTKARTLVFDAAFSEPVSGLVSGGFSNTANATGSILEVRGLTVHIYPLTVSSCTADTVVLLLADAVINTAV